MGEFVSQLKRFRTACEKSPFVRGHECIGTSILFIADAEGRCDAFWIDFAKTHEVPGPLGITHRCAWSMGNHEDGLLTGIDNLVHTWERVAASLREVYLVVASSIANTSR